MYPEMQRDIRTFIADTDKVKQGLSKLKQDCALWNRDSERKDMTDLLEFLKQLETDVAIMEADWIGFISRSDKKRTAAQTVDTLQKAFVNLNVLFTDLKHLKSELSDAFILSANIEKFEVDWCRFGKTVDNILKNLGATANKGRLPRGPN